MAAVTLARYGSDLGLTVNEVPQANQHTEIGSDFYFGGSAPSITVTGRLVPTCADGPDFGPLDFGNCVPGYASLL